MTHTFSKKKKKSIQKRGETLTVVKLRENLKEIDFTGRSKLAFIEYLLFKYKKTLAQLFSPPPAGGKHQPPIHLLRTPNNNWGLASHSYNCG